MHGGEINFRTIVPRNVLKIFDVVFFFCKDGFFFTHVDRFAAAVVEVDGGANLHTEIASCTIFKVDLQ